MERRARLSGSDRRSWERLVLSGQPDGFPDSTKPLWCAASLNDGQLLPTGRLTLLWNPIGLVVLSLRIFLLFLHLYWGSWLGSARRFHRWNKLEYFHLFLFGFLRRPCPLPVELERFPLPFPDM